jgi:hypothetical protein
MKAYILILIAFLGLASTMTAQPIINVAGKEVTYDTTGTFAVVTLVGNLGTFKYVGEINMREGLMVADSVALWCSFSDSIRIAFYVMPKSIYKTPTYADTVAACLPAATATFHHVQNGAGHVIIPWYKITAALGGTIRGAQEYDVYVRIEKIAGLFTYGKTTGQIKAAGKVRIVATRQF